MMGDLLYPGGADLPVRVVDNGDGHYQITVAAEPNLHIYPSFAEWKALEGHILAGLQRQLDGWRITAGFLGARINDLEAQVARQQPDPRRYPCISCGQPADGDSAQCQACEAKPTTRIEHLTGVSR